MIRKYFSNSANTAPLLVLSIFALLLFSRMIDSSVLTRENEYIAIIVLQLLVFLVPSAVYVRALRRDFTSFRIYPFGLGHLLLMVSALIILSSGSMLLDYYLRGYESLSEGYDLWGLFISKNDRSAGDVIYLILAYAALPALCEEFVFRGLLVSEYEKRSSFSAIVLTSLFFAMLHFDILRFPVYFFSGIVMVLTLYATRSLLATVVVHFCHNMIGIFGRTYLQTLFDLGGENLFIFLISALFLLFAGIFCGEAARLYKAYAKNDFPSGYRALDPPYEGGASQLEEFAVKHPRLTASAGALFSLPSLLCYVLYTVAVYIDF